MNQFKQRMGYWMTAVALVFLFGEAQAAVKLDAVVEYPQAVGTAAQNFNSNIGVGGDLYLDPLIAPWISNFLYVGYSNFTLRSDTSSSFYLVPALVGLGLPGKVTDGLTTEFDVAAGAAVGYLSSSNFRTYFSAQVRGMVEYDLGGGFSALIRTPVTFVVGTNSIAYVSYTGGVAFKF